MRPWAKYFAEPVGSSGLTLTDKMAQYGLTKTEVDIDGTEASPSTGAKGVANELEAYYGLGRQSVTVVGGDEDSTVEIHPRYLKDYLGGVS